MELVLSIEQLRELVREFESVLLLERFSSVRLIFTEDALRIIPSADEITYILNRKA